MMSAQYAYCMKCIQGKSNIKKPLSFWLTPITGITAVSRRFSRGLCLSSFERKDGKR
jgi:hypothetical protein